MTSTYRLPRWFGWAVALTFVFGGVACEKSPRQKLLDVKRTLASDGDLGAAEKKLKSVLDKKPDNLEAQRLLGSVYIKQGNYEKAESQLEKFWKEHNFGDESAQLSTGLRTQKRLTQQLFVDLYNEWGKDIDQKENPEKFVETVEKGLEYDEKNMDLNGMLVDFYWNKGQRLVEEGKKKEAAKAFEEISQLRTTRGDDRRQKAEKKARDLRLEFFKDEGKKRFDKEVEPMLADMSGFELDEKGETILIDYNQDVDRRLNPNKPKHAKQAKQFAIIGLVDKLRKIALGIAGLPPKTDLNQIGTNRAKQIFLGSDELKIEDDQIDVSRGNVGIETKLSVDAAVGMAYDVKAAYEDAQEAAESKGGSGGDADAGQSDDSPDAGSE